MSIVLQSVSLLATHLAVALLTVATALACLHGMQVRRLKSKPPRRSFGPSLASIDQAVRVLVAFGVALLTCDLVRGHLLVGASFFLFSAYLLTRAAGAWHRPRHTIWLLLGSACLVSTCAASAIPNLVVR